MTCISIVRAILLTVFVWGLSFVESWKLSSVLRHVLEVKSATWCSTVHRGRIKTLVHDHLLEGHLWRLNCVEFHRSIQLLGCPPQFLLLKIPLSLTVRLWLLDLHYFTWVQNRFRLVYLCLSWLLIPEWNYARLSELLGRFASRLFDNLRSLQR